MAVNGSLERIQRIRFRFPRPICLSPLIFFPTPFGFEKAPDEAKANLFNPFPKSVDSHPYPQPLQKTCPEFEK
jgi:hypothetical protein